METPASSPSCTLHATTVAIDGRAVLLCGPSGAGKSDLALRLVDRGAVLVSDDQTIVRRVGDQLIASAPATIAGLIEIRGIGIVTMPHAGPVPVAARVTLGSDVVRMPEPSAYDILGLRVADHYVDAMTASAPLKIELLLRRSPA
ncbi:aldolase [Sphingomonas sp. Leaf17]|uniref:HPr kinase/phosphorylase n=1 Tax=Sphingomonas sp. Leaf17 TaxID=1735683 RepID=UPI000700F8C4|nr:aldolase [Sphingomonas sp. Leaf17]KQM65849.1 aldolase [Sphingomonas sp. Leaf17]